MKRLLLLGILCIGSMSGMHADNGAKGKKAKTSVRTSNDTSYNESGFNDLFVNASNNTTNGARLNPRAISFVQDYFTQNGKDLQDMKGWGRPYFNLIDGILSQYGLPTELKYLAVIESNLKPTATGSCGHLPVPRPRP